MYRNNRGSNKRYKAIDQIIKRAKDDITIPFLGCLHVFEYQKPAWTDMSKLQTNGWNFMQRLFDPWRAIDMEEINKMDSKRLAKQKYWSDNPKINVKYILGMHRDQRIPKTMFLELHMLWTDQFPMSIKKENIKTQHEDFSNSLKGLDSRSVKQFYKIACMNSQRFQSYLMERGDSRQVSIPKRFNEGNILAIIGADHVSIDLTEDIENYFKRLNDELVNNLEIEYNEAVSSGSILFSYASQKKAQALKDIKQAINSAKSRVTFAFLGSLVKIYDGRLQQDGLEQVLQSGWSFLKEQFSTWIKYKFRDSQVTRETDMIKLKPVTKNSVDTPLEIFHYMLTRPNRHVPMNFVRTLLNLWIHNLSSLEQSERTIHFKIPLPIKDHLGKALNNPKKLFS
ncbi:hypothetical protein DFH28DRAFT_943193 [Melampsora americana]|nr:hypothetical protein DFH28DRAFT_943193 [Melampsora americana]